MKTFYFRYQQSLQVTRLMMDRYPATTLKMANETPGDPVKAPNRGEDIRVNLPPGVRSKGLAHGTPETGITVGALLSQMFRFAVTRGMLEARPVVALGRPGGSEIVQSLHRTQ